MTTLRCLDSTATFEAERCQVARAHGKEEISLCSFFIASSDRVVLGGRYVLDLDGEDLLVVPFECIQREIGRTQILALIVEPT